MSQSTPLVSVYITTFNRKELLARAVESVRNQTYPNVEIIVADDGSTDETHDYLREMERLGLLKVTINTSGQSKGACFGRNNAIAIAEGKFITGLDDDDYFEPWRVASFFEQWKKLEANGKLSSVAGLYDSVIELRSDGKYKYNEKTVSSHSDLRKSNSVGNQVFTLKKYLEDINGFDVEMPALQDWDTWLRLSNKHGILINILKYSYVIDQVHGEARISEKKAEKIRLAFTLLNDKLTPLSRQERASHLESLYAYKQLNFKWAELVILTFSGKVRRVAQVLKRSLIGA